MKNVIPLIVAVILGLAAVYLVSNMLIDHKDLAKEPQVSVVIAARDLAAGEELSPGACSFKTIPRSAMPETAILWENVSLTYGQKIPHELRQGSYIMFEDIQLNLSLAECVAAGEWLIPVTFSDATLVKMLRPQDEIAIAAAYVTKEAVPPKLSGINELDADEVVSSSTVEVNRELVILFPCVEVIGIDNSSGLFRESGSASASSTIYVTLPPRQATILLEAQQEAELYPILRRKNDTSALNRAEIGIVSGKTFEKVRADLEPAVLPDAAAAPMK